MTWSWWAFIAGMISSFVVSFGAMVGWWFLLIGRHEPEPMDRVQQDFEQVREAIRRRKAK